jgi:cbb3-type cytochrome oxidase maturation protein
MEILYVLIPLSVGLVAFALWSFVWSVNNRQFDDLERHGWAVLFDETTNPEPDGKPDQTKDKKP